jgi:ATP-dependent DNA ligase
LRRPLGLLGTSQPSRSIAPSIHACQGPVPAALLSNYMPRMLWRVSPKRSRSPDGFIKPAQPTLVRKPPIGPDWIHEVKHDGYRLLARKEAGRVALWTRHGTDFTDRLPRVAEAVRSLPVEAALIDGEAVQA